ncbi:MAG: hypothetical protein GXP49_13335 [Deltaproteobacteria bacterium]|nr:hypothetical protein [Deltaproteobacteria bacterium]
MSGQKRINWIGYAFLSGVQLFSAWVFLFYVPATVDWYLDHGQKFEVPEILHGFWNSGSSLQNDPFFWFPLWAIVLAGLAFVVWRFRSRWWPLFLVTGLAVVQLAYLITMMIITSQHLAMVAGG